MASLNGKCQFVADRYSVWETLVWERAQIQAGSHARRHVLSWLGLMSWKHVGNVLCTHLSLFPIWSHNSGIAQGHLLCPGSLPLVTHGWVALNIKPPESWKPPFLRYCLHPPFFFLNSFYCFEIFLSLPLPTLNHNGIYSWVSFPQTMNFNCFRGSLSEFEYNYTLWVQIVVFTTEETNGNDPPVPVVYRLYASELGVSI